MQRRLLARARQKGPSSGKMRTTRANRPVAGISVTNGVTKFLNPLFKRIIIEQSGVDILPAWHIRSHQ